MLGCKLGTPLAEGIMLGWLDGHVDIDGFSDNINDGCPDTLGTSDGRDDGSPVLVGLKLGWLDGWADTEG